MSAAFDAAETRAATNAASVVALCLQVNALASLGEGERSAAVAAEALRRAEQTGNAVMVAAAVIVDGATPTSFSVAEPDFAASLDVLARHGVGLRSGTFNDMWLDITRGETLLGLGRPGAVEHVARAAWSADRLNVPRHARPGVADRRDRGRRSRPHPTGSHAGRLHRSRPAPVPGRPARPSMDPSPASTRLSPESPSSRHPPQRHRREIMNLVDDLETALTQVAPDAP